MKIKAIAQLHVCTIFFAGLFMTHNTPIITGYIVGSFFLWIFAYPLYFMLGEPGWDDL